MRKITFIGSTSSNYLFGRGKDKKRRKFRTLLTNAKDFIKKANIKSPKDLIDRYQRRKDGSAIATKAGVIGGLLVGNGQNIYKNKKNLVKGLSGTANKLNTLNTTLIGLNIGSEIDYKISKEKARYRKKGSRTHLGKIGHDTRTGALAVSNALGIQEAFKQFQRPGNLNSKLLKMSGGAIYGGVKGALLGGAIGSGVGTIRGFRQKNKKKK